MPFTSGTSTDYLDLLADLRTWLTATVGWTELSWVAPGANAELMLRAPGAGVANQVFVNIRSEANATIGSYSWRISAATDYVPGLAWGSQPNESPRPYINLWNSTINYWFYANDRRVIVVAKTSTTYTMMYLGFFLPWCTPTQFPFPLYVGGDYSSAVAWNTANAARRFFVDPGGSYGSSLSSGWVRSPEGVWTPMLNHSFAATVDAHQSSRDNASGFISPYGTIGGPNGDPSINTWTAGASSSGGALDLCLATAQDERLMVPVHLCRQRSQPLGALDGVFCPFGSGLTTEQAVTAGGRDFVAFQNLNRNSGNDFVLIEEVA